MLKAGLCAFTCNGAFNQYGLLEQIRFDFLQSQNAKDTLARA